MHECNARVTVETADRVTEETSVTARTPITLRSLALMQTVLLVLYVLYYSVVTSGKRMSKTLDRLSEVGLRGMYSGLLTTSVM